MIVTTSDASTLAEDARTLQTVELPSQADDLDGDNKADEIVFQIDLKPRQTRIVTIAYGEQFTIARLRGVYEKRTHAKFTTKYEGLGWESDLTAWRIYFDKRNAIDLFGKKRPGLYLEMFGTPDWDYHAESPLGRDIYDVGDGLGLGSVGAYVNGKAEKVAEVAERKWRILSDGPVRSAALSTRRKKRSLGQSGQPPLFRRVCRLATGITCIRGLRCPVLLAFSPIEFGNIRSSRGETFSCRGRFPIALDIRDRSC